MPNNNKLRVGYGTSTNVNPRFQKEHIEDAIRKLEPESTPFLTLANMISRKKAPQGHKIGIKLYDAFDHWDSTTFVSSYETVPTIGPSVAKLAVSQRSRPRDSQIIYRPQDTIWVQSTGQVLEILATARGQHEVITSNNDLKTYFSETANAPKGLEIIVRSVDGTEVVPFSSTSDFVWLERQIYESANIEGETVRSEPYLDYNFVMHMESLFTVTEDTKNLVKVEGNIPSWVHDKEEQIRRFKRSVNFNMIFQERAIIMDPQRPDEPKRHMRGMLNWINQNVTYYNPHSIEDFEILVLKMVNRSWFKHYKSKTKTLMCGRGFHEMFSMAFRDYRRHDTNQKTINPGFKVETYAIGDFTIKLSVDDSFGLNTDAAYWGMIIDPTEMGLHVVKDFTVRSWQPESSRKWNHMIEWQGTITPGRTEYHALLRTA
jgi:hypothetical protein